ncbi:DUF4440 domain-containing protein [Halobacillus litoralis]|uniref:nuclear transport factor 2 family protein n=1 Tax=Halobacillus litoralis TaxID=45668 RepID=UPI001CD74DAE|nr:DUF4440 domain-containing protein [Halobacillus litoralis]MCA0970173.1 DUF4440 domain-containing protein [Halobacillus litoralis]
MNAYSRQLEETLLRLEKDHIHMEVRSSTLKLSQLLADDFWEFGSSGVIYDREHCLNEGVVLTDMTIHHYGIEILAEHVVLATYFLEDLTRKRNTFRSSIWKRQGAEWKLSFHQGTITNYSVGEVDFKTLRSPHFSS